MHEIDKVITACRNLVADGKRGVLVTVVRTEGSTYRRTGARAVISETGAAFGAISGGCLERDLAERIKPWLAEMTPRVVTYDSTRESDLVFGMGLGCRGILDLLVEPFDAAHTPPLVQGFAWKGREPVEWTTKLPDGTTVVEVIRPQRAIVLYGAGLDVEPVVTLARQSGFRIDVVTTRAAIDLTPYDAAVVMTHNFHRDVEILRSLLASNIPYIGLLGPRRRGDELLAEVGAPRDSRIHSPIGLDLGAETPEEIALSIVAEIQAVLTRRSARHLRELQSPIHEPNAVPSCA
ncbi:MAG TPA: XdhC family protein [Thermoanaerobaculia bacterium]|jgi:xanthine/CO dehydrogenase XdhC/CoxF family maturation factor